MVGMEVGVQQENETAMGGVHDSVGSLNHKTSEKVGLDRWRRRHGLLLGDRYSSHVPTNVVVWPAVPPTVQ